MTVGWGIIGIGNIADRATAPHVQELSESELVAVVSRDQGRADAFAKKHSARHAYTNYDQMLANPDVQVVAIHTPNGLHAEQAIAAARVVVMKALAARPSAASPWSCSNIITAPRMIWLVWPGLQRLRSSGGMFR